MAVPRSRCVAAIGVATILLLSSGIALSQSGHLMGAPRATASPSSSAAIVPSSASPRASPVSPGAASSGSDRVQRVLQEVHRSGAPTADLHLPDLSVPRPYAGEAVAPTYASAPAPMGVADLGLTNSSGTLTPYVVTSSSVRGQITLNNAQSVNVDGDGPDMFGIQLNAVLTNVTLFGNSSNEFWTQNFVSYTPASGQLVFGDNVWNFSNFDAYLSPNAFYATGPNGTLYAPVYYYAIGPTFTIHYPFTLTMYENSTDLFDRPAVFFNYTVSNSTMRTSGSFDYVVFNATVGAPSSAIPAGVFQISGEQLDPVGLPNDLEMDVVGNDDGDTTSFYQMNASLSIATWDSTSRAFVAAPSAMDAGSETGETSDGVSVAYRGSTPVGLMTLGPSFIYGLWGESPNSGARNVVQILNPAGAFIFVNPGTVLDQKEAQWVPSSPTGTTTFDVPNGGSYWFEFLMADQSPGSLILSSVSNSTVRQLFNMTADPSMGVYTPLIAFGNGELANISSGGTGTAARPYTILNNEYGPLNVEFDAWNDFQFPVFPGLLLIGTTAYVSVTPPSFQINYPDWMQGGPTGVVTDGLPLTNNLQIQFWETTNVRVVGGSISGWLSANLAGFPEGSVMFWNSSGNLVARNTFLDAGDSIVLFGGTGNTIWGNQFLPAVLAGATNPAAVLNYPDYAQGVNESESGDLIYNNYFDVPFPAITPLENPLSCQVLCEPSSYLDAWNVSLAPADASRTVLGEILTGSIIGSWYQGGNFWSNYGDASNAYGVLPYNNSGAVSPGGDFLPLLLFSVYNVTFHETGLVHATPWGISTQGITTMSNRSALTISVPNGTDEFAVVSPAGYLTEAPSNFTVDGAATQVDVTFALSENLTFRESGLPAGLLWTVSLVGSELGGISVNSSASARAPVEFTVSSGAYSFNVSSEGFAASPSYGNVTVGGGANEVSIAFIAQAALTFTESGLPTGTTWSVWFTQFGSTTAFESSTSTIAIMSLLTTPGAYNFTVAAAGFVANPPSGTGLLPQNASQNVTFLIATGGLRGTVDPLSASVWVEAVATPTNSDGSFAVTLPIGVYSLEVAAAGYTTYFNNVSLGAGDVTLVSVNLTAAPGGTSAATTGIDALGWALIVGLAILAGLLLVAVVILAGRRRPPRETVPSEESSPDPPAEIGPWVEGPRPSAPPQAPPAATTPKAKAPRDPWSDPPPPL